MNPHWILIFELAGLLLGALALLFPTALIIFLFFTLGNFFILIGLAGYIMLVLKDLKKHEVL